MSYCGMVFRLSYKRLAALRGSKTTRLLAQLTPHLQEDDEYDEDDECDDEENDRGDEDDEHPEAEDEPIVTRVEALRHFIMGKPLGADYPESYAAALHAICLHIGEMLDNSSVAPANWDHFEAVDAALRGNGIGAPISVRDLFSRGLPVMDLPSPEPFPTVGFVTPEEALTARGRIRAFDWSNHSSEVQQTIRQLDYWIDEAAGEGHGLIGFYG